MRTWLVLAVLALAAMHSRASEFSPPPASSTIGVPITVDLEEAKQWLLAELATVGTASTEIREEKCAVRGDVGKFLDKLSANPTCAEVKGRLEVNVLPESLRLEAVEGGLGITVAAKVKVDAETKLVANLVKAPTDIDGVVEASATVTFSVRPDWTLAPAVTFDHRWVNRPDLSVAGFKVATVTSRLDELIERNRAAFTARIKAQLAELLDARVHAARAWEELRFQREIMPNIWLTSLPVSMGFAPPKREGNGLVVNLSVETLLRVHEGEARLADAKPLPPPRMPEDVSSSVFEIPVRFSVSTLTDLVKTSVGAQDLSIEAEDMSTPVVISDWHAHAQGGRLFVSADLTPNAPALAMFEAKVHFSSGIDFDHETQRLVAIDVEVDDETSPALRMLAATLIPGLTDSLSWDAPSAVGRLLERVQLNPLTVPIGDESDGVSIRLEVSEARVVTRDVRLDGTDVVVDLSMPVIASASLSFKHPFPSGLQATPVNLPFGAGPVVPSLAPANATLVKPVPAPNDRTLVLPTPPSFHDGGRPLTGCSCPPNPVGQILPTSACSTGRGIVTACTYPCDFGRCFAAPCRDGHPGRQLTCTFPQHAPNPGEHRDGVFAR